MIILICIAFLSALTAFYFFYRIPHPQCSKNSTSRVDEISIIIPARNEAHSIERLLKSIQSQPIHPKEVIVINDHSTDQTAILAQQLGATVIDSKPLPKGWTGKNFACYQGAKAAQGKLLLFLDADTWFSPQAFKKIPNILQSADVVSICPYHHVPKLYEQLSAFFNILMLAGSGAFTYFSIKTHSQKLFGQSLLIEKTAYFEVKGHAQVKSMVLENFHLAKHLIKKNYTLRCYGGKNFLNMRMFPTNLNDLTQGWMKAFANGAQNTDTKILILTSLWLSACMFSSFSLVFLLHHSELVSLMIAVLYIFLSMQLSWMLKKIGSYRLTTAIFFPIPLLFFMAIFNYSILKKKLGKPTLWKGRPVA